MMTRLSVTGVKVNPMAKHLWIRLSGLAAILSGVIGILNIPLLALAYMATADGQELLDSPVVAVWVAVVRPLLAPLLTFATPDVVYSFYGKVLLVVFPGLMAGLIALHTRQAAHSGRLERVGFGLALLSTFLFTCGVIGAYYLDLLEFSFLAFLIPGLLTMLIAPLVLGIGTLQAGIAPRQVGWLLILGGLPGFLLTRSLAGHNSGGLFFFDVALIVTGYWLWSGRDEVIA